MKPSTKFSTKSRFFISILTTLFLGLLMFSGPPANAYNPTYHRAAIAEGMAGVGVVMEPNTLRNLNEALMKPDSDQWYWLPAHCDGGDYLSSEDNAGQEYPVTREDADEFYLRCVQDMVRFLDKSVATAGDLLIKDSDGGYSVDETQLVGNTNCVLEDQWVWKQDPVSGNYRYLPSGNARDSRAKCGVLEYFGRTLHATTDFYAHTNYSDQANPNLPLGVENPPGLNQGKTPSPLLETYTLWAATAGKNQSIEVGAAGDQNVREAILANPQRIPQKLTSGCWRYDTDPRNKCDNRISEVDTMQKDTPSDNRSQAAPGNFENAYAAAAADSGRQWNMLVQALEDRYGVEPTKLLVKAIVEDKAGRIAPPSPEPSPEPRPQPQPSPTAEATATPTVTPTSAPTPTPSASQTSSANYPVEKSTAGSAVQKNNFPNPPPPVSGSQAGAVNLSNTGASHLILVSMLGATLLLAGAAVAVAVRLRKKYE